MPIMTFGEVWSYINDGGIIALLMLIIWGGMTGKYVFRREYDEQKQRADRFEAIVMKMVNTAEKVAGKVEQ